MRFAVHKKEKTIVITVDQGSLKGTEVAFVERIQMGPATLNPMNGALATGNIRATWGLQMLEEVNLAASTLHALGINRPFVGAPWAVGGRLGKHSGRVYLLSERGAILTGTAQLLDLTLDEVRYSL